MGGGKGLHTCGDAVLITIVYYSFNLWSSHRVGNLVVTSPMGNGCRGCRLGTALYFIYAIALTTSMPR